MIFLRVTILDQYGGFLGWGLSPQILAINFNGYLDRLGRLIIIPQGLSNQAIKIERTL